MHIVIRGKQVRVQFTHTDPRGRNYYRVYCECPSCVVPGPIFAYPGEGGDLYCECGDFHLGPLEGAAVSFVQKDLGSATVHETPFLQKPR